VQVAVVIAIGLTLYGLPLFCGHAKLTSAPLLP
jgi:hypothetical protein